MILEQLAQLEVKEKKEIRDKSVSKEKTVTEEIGLLVLLTTIKERLWIKYSLKIAGFILNFILYSRTKFHELMIN